MILLGIILAYGIVGIAVAGAFFARGVTVTMPEASLTLGARILLLPGAIALWPLILGRWIKSRATP